jgi:SAM-dependent methyltransferase
MMTALRAYIRQQQFAPDWMGIFVNPFFLARRRLWSAVAGTSRHLGGSLLDVGCGSRPYQTLFNVDRYIGLEIDSASARRAGAADVYYDGRRFPFTDGEFQSVLCNQVLEHVFDPDEFLREVHRVLCPGGQLLLTVPFVWDEHEQPNDYARYSSYGLQALLERNGFSIVQHQKLLDDFSLIFQLVNAFVFKVTRTRHAVINFAVTALVMAPLSVAGLLFGAMLPRNEDLFLDQLVLARRS